MTQSTIDSELEKILVEMSVDIIDPLASDLEPTQEAVKRVTNLIAQEANKARIDEIKMALDWFTNESGYLFYLDDRIKALTADKKQAE